MLVTVVRHGESTDNLRAVWAGHLDAPLSQYGMEQAKRVGASFKHLPITAIYASDLKRAHWTAQQIHSQNAGPSPSDRQTASSPSRKRTRSTEIDHPHNDAETAGPDSSARLERASQSRQDSTSANAPCDSDLGRRAIATTPLLREQFFGDAEGKGWQAGSYSNAPYESKREFKFPNGETLHDVGKRADKVVRQIILPWLLREANERGSTRRNLTAPSSLEIPDDTVHLVLVAHGIMISELLHAFHRAADPRAPWVKRGGLQNTGWGRMHMVLDPVVLDDLPPGVIAEAYAATEATEFPELIPALSPSSGLLDLLRPQVKLLAMNQTDHLNGHRRQPGGLSRQAFDAKQQTLMSFMSGGGGGTASPSPKKKSAS
ncbi:uncharacterized protein L969DRAFT_91971 [Mixia osmundae IAM 14324]|uniref:Uncharacterized protein n=1 Tax=Mixia osmundae (strain CBS 9802 / IAM 14324 / JCM 22182 / KY 12970) TaxID=764103 RepID=G7E2Z9_MIXOS|nr:uncharacterized protein L969DRAFT_91971 [Mixia osmundae IAM 14324]KEI42531.1 hypothetical protein L969DRAFT_91971 [Mixia osmundae IAM 14324]GAA97180.1 hypothetical protein E5Q_03856 [Mixia osmundae IAM 14324]